MDHARHISAGVRHGISTLLSLSLALTGMVGLGLTTVPAQAQSDAPSTQVADYVRQGDRHFADGNYEAAIEAYTQALSIFNMHAYAYYNRANAYRKLQNYDAAIADYNRTLRLNPDNLFAYRYRGLALAKVGQLEAAVTDYTEVIRRNPKDAKAYHSRGDAYAALNNTEAALVDYKEASKLYYGARKYRQHSEIQKRIKAVKR